MKVKELLQTPLPLPSGPAAQYLDRLVRELDVPVARYEEARRRYDSVGRWLCRDESTLKDLAPDVYVQGSFRLGTPIRPINDDEHYDIDLVCELSASKEQRTQEQLKQLLGEEIRLYAKAHGMEGPSESRRCWTLDYAEGAQFHLDALPAIPDGQQKRQLLIEAKLNDAWAETAIAITDNQHHAYRILSERWPHSNPRGFTEWFRSRMATNFRQIREAMALEAKASVEDVPAYTVKTPLQQAVQLLKRHRDVMFEKDPEHKPISVIITTLAGLAYQGERTVGEAIRSILERLDSAITVDAAGLVYIPNPTDAQENFADKWKGAPEKRIAFFNWLRKVRDDFAFLASQTTQQQLVESASRAFGQRPARAATSGASRFIQLGGFLGRASAFLTASHKQQAPWPATTSGTVAISKATWTGRGFSRPIRLVSDGQPLMKGASISFEATTNIPAPFDVYWQVVNTGAEAAAARKLRGGFDVGTVVRGSIKHSEDAGYSGAHTIECFIVKNRHLAARSGVFIVNVM